MHLYSLVEKNYDNLNEGLRLVNTKLNKNMDADVVIVVHKDVGIKTGIAKKSRGFIKSLWYFVKAVFSRSWVLEEEAKVVELKVEEVKVENLEIDLK